MRIATREIYAALAIAAVGIFGGISLSAFTERGMWPQSRNAPVSAFALPEAGSPAIAPAPVTPYEPPEQYVCKGCGPTLAERRMQYYAYGDYGYRSEILGDAPADDTAPLTEYDAPPYEEGTGEDAGVGPDAHLSEQAASDAAVVAYPSRLIRPRSVRAE